MIRHSLRESLTSDILAASMERSAEDEPVAVVETPQGLRASVEGGSLAVRDRDGRLLLRFSDDGAAELTVPTGDLTLRAAEGRVCIEGKAGVSITGSTIELAARRISERAEVLETRVTRLVERAVDVYRDVDGLAQLRANDVRVLARRTFTVLGDRLRLRAKVDAKVQAPKVYLA